MKRGMAAAVASLIVTAMVPLAGIAPAAAQAYCTADGPLDVDALPERVPLSDCDLVGRTIVAGPLETRVPPPGQGHSVIGLTNGGEVRLEVSTSADGVVQIHTEELTAEDEHDHDRSASGDFSAASMVSGGNTFAEAATLQVPNSFSPAGGPTFDLSAAVVEEGEPTPGCDTTATGSLWYRIRPLGSAQRVKLRADVPLAVYTGTSLDTLKRVRCIPANSPEALLLLTSADPYHVQAGVRPDTFAPQVWLFNAEMRPDGAPPCDVKTHALMQGATPRKAWKWRFNSADRPDDMTVRQTLRGIKRGVNIVTGSKNDCGMPDRVGARASYLGRTKKRPTACTGRLDGVNVIGFGSTGFAIGIACSAWTVDGSGDRHVFESDIVISDSTAWTVKPDSVRCQSENDLVSVVVHETGHVFGLDHAEGTKGLNQTMAPGASACNGAHRTLGRGDVVGLRKLY